MLFLTRALLIQFDRSAGAAGFHPLGQFGGGLDPQLILDVLEVRFDRLDAPGLDPGNLARGPALADQPEHLQFAIA